MKSIKNLKLTALCHALALAVYVALVILVMFNAEQAFDNFLAPVAFLLLFVLSATITATLVLGKPILLYLENRKADAVKLFLYTIGWIFLITLIIFIIGIWL